MLKEVVCSVLDFDAVDKLVILSAGESDYNEFVVRAFEVVKDC
jgi:hypothetical protein